VVYVRKDRVTATGDATFSTIPVKDRTTDFGGNGLGCADLRSAHVGASVVAVCAQVCASADLLGSICAHVGVNVADVLPVALRHLDDFGTDFDELPAALLRCPAAALANRERDLVA